MSLIIYLCLMIVQQINIFGIIGIIDATDKMAGKSEPLQNR